MKYGLMQKAMWSFYKGSFKKHLTKTLKEANPNEVMKKAHKKYKEILSSVQEFDKKDRFLVNILSCALLSSILLSVENKYTKEEIRIYYKLAMCENKMTKLASKKSKAYTEKGRALLKTQAKKSETINNPYSWRFSVTDGPTINQYTAYFHTCGICYLMTKLGLKEYIPAMCALDYDMAELNNTTFTREQTLASGGIYCDCHYDHHPTKKRK